jgi:C4-dicarboxylate transporter DctM subunit
LTPELICVMAIALMIILLGFGMPVAFAMAISGFVGYGLISGFERAVSILSLVPWQSLASYGFTVIPMFVFMGMLASEAGFGEDIYFTLRRWVGRISGSLAITTCMGCAAFGTLSGDAISTAVTMGRIAIPEMEKAGYNTGLSLASVAAAGPIAAMIPPSVLICIYGVISEQSVGKLLMAGFLPGILTAVLFSLTIYIRARFNPSLAPTTSGATWMERIVSLKRIVIVLACSVAIIGGIYSGIFTPTEAGGMGALIIMVGAFATRRLSWSKFRSAVAFTLRVTVMFGAILMGAFLFGYMVTVSGLVSALLGFMESLSLPTIGIVLGIMLVFLILGSFMQAVAMLFVTMPFILPIMASANIDPIWMGILIVHMCEVGCITPPFGITLFAVKSVKPEIRTTTIIKGILPFLIADVVVLLLLVLFPQIALIVPSMMH